MIDAKKIKVGQVSLTKEMIRQEVFDRGWDMWFIDLDLPIMVIRRSDGKKLRVYGSAPPPTSYVAAMVSNDKIATYQLFTENNLPTPKTEIIEAGSGTLKLLTDCISVVVKPVDAAHGNGVTVDIKTEKDYRAAIKYAKQFSDRILVQECIDSAVDIRILCIDYKFTAALIRIPARVRGDGMHTVEQLINVENTCESRGLNYSKVLNKIEVEQAKKFLGEKISSVPAQDEIIEVVGTANVGSGGETMEVTNDVPKWLREMSEKAAKVSELVCCGVDFLLKAEPKSSSSYEELQPMIIEINKSPALFIHEKPTHGKPQPVIKKFVDYLASL